MSRNQSALTIWQKDWFPYIACAANDDEWNDANDRDSYLKESSICFLPRMFMRNSMSIFLHFIFFFSFSRTSLRAVDFVKNIGDDVVDGRVPFPALSFHAPRRKFPI